MTNYSPSPSAHGKEQGFTLAELAIVMVIMALLLAGMLMPLSSQREIQRLNDTRRALADAKESLLGFALANCRLPCPADATLVTGSANAGIEEINGATGNCVAQEGTLPWTTLGLPETDAWGRRYRYQVTAKFSNKSGVSCTPLNQAFSLNDNGDIKVVVSAGGNSLATQIPAIVLSHGINGSSAYIADGSQLPASGDADEIENANGDKTFVSKTLTPTFDDLIEWISPFVLKSRMTAAGRLP